MSARHQPGRTPGSNPGSKIEITPGITPDMSVAQAACQALSAAMAADPHIVVLGEDVGRGGIFGQYLGLQQRFGADRVIDTPISEATIMGAGVGMALAGCKPVVEMRVIDFALCAMDEIANQAAKVRYMSGGQGRIAKGLPLLARLPIGIWSAAAAQHSQSLEAWLVHLPGVVVTAPCTAQDNADLLLAALACGDPVMHLEHKELWASTLRPPGAETPLQLGQSRTWRQGHDLTLVSWSRQMHWAAEAAEQLALQGIQTDLIDLATLWPWDRDAVLASCARTGHLLVTHEAVQVAGLGAEIAATAAEHTGCKVRRAGAPRIPVGYAPTLEEVARVRPAAIVQAALALLQ